MSTTIAQRCLRYFGEFIGTFVFLTVIINYGGTRYGGFPIGLALAVMVFAFGYITKGAFNPAVSLMLAVQGEIDWTDFAIYVLVQCLAAMAVYGMWVMFQKNGAVPPNETPLQ